MHDRPKKSIFTLFFTLFLLTVFIADCGKKEEKPQADAMAHGSAGDREERPGKRDREGKPDKQGKQEEKIDIDKLDIPERMKEAIKSGRIPMERVKQFMEMQKSDAPLVKIERVARKSLNSYLVLNGTVEPERSVNVYSRLTAYVKQLQKEEGDFVKEGTVLALLDDTEIKIAHQQAKIQLDQAELAWKDAERNYQRNVELKKTEFISEMDFQTAEAAFKKAKLDYQDRLEGFKNLELQLNWTKIRAPVDGYVTERLIEVGDNVNANQHVYTVEDFSPLLVRVYVPSSDVIRLKERMKAEVSSEILEGSTFMGDIKLINPRIDVQSGTVKVTVEVFDKTGKLTPGMFVEVKIIIGEKKGILVIPRKSVQYKQDKAYVYVFSRMQVSKREIVPGMAEEDQIEVLEGLAEGEAIVTVGVESLKDGMRVKVAR